MKTSTHFSSFKRVVHCFILAVICLSVPLLTPSTAISDGDEEPVVEEPVDEEPEVKEPEDPEDLEDEAEKTPKEKKTLREKAHAACDKLPFGKKRCHRRVDKMFDKKDKAKEIGKKIKDALSEDGGK